MMLPITSLIALPLGLLLVGLACRVAVLRLRNKIGLGVSKNQTLARAIAAHDNAVENIPIALVLLLIAELQKLNPLLLIICGVTFIAGRLMNAYGVSQHAGQTFGRFYGTIMSWFVIITLAIANAWTVLSGF